MSNYADNAFTDDPHHVWTKLLAMIPERSRVLDIGCSSGNLGVTLIQRKHCTVDGIEIDEADAKKAAEVLGRVWVFNIEDLDQFKQITKKYDILIFADVLEHLVDPSRVLRAMSKLLKPGGKIVFSLPNMAHISVRLALLTGSFHHTETGLIDKTHIHFYDVEELGRMFVRGGMVIDKLDYSPYPYPKRLIQQKLNDVGLELTPESLKVFNGPAAVAFQYVGSAVYETKKHAKRTELVPFEQPLHNDLHMLAAVVTQKDDEIEVHKKHIKHLEEEVVRAHKALTSITHSRTYRWAQKAVRPYHGLRQAVHNQKNKSNGK